MDNLSNQDTIVAAGIVADIFDEIRKCIRMDRSKVKLGTFEKAFISRLLGNATENGITNYIDNMYTEDVTRLIDRLERRFNSRQVYPLKSSHSNIKINYAATSNR